MSDSRPESFYQTVNFHFNVSFVFEPGNEVDMRFQSVGGLDSTIETEIIKEGGENRFEHVLPIRRKYGPLTLKRGILRPRDSKLTQWLKGNFDGGLVTPIKELTIQLLDERHQSLMFWKVNNVWPRSWKVGELNAEKGEVLIETLELNYNRLIFDNS